LATVVMTLVQAPHIPRVKSHVPFPLLRLYQRVNPSPRQLWTFRNTAVFKARSC